MHSFNRRRFLRGALRGSAGLAAGLSLGGLSLSSLARAQTTCGPRTADNIEGPFFRADAPHRADLALAGEAGQRLTLGGRVTDARCRPLRDAVLEVWHADAAGDYDNLGNRHRGVLRCDPEGRYTLRTVVPGRYRVGASFRPAHIHVKVHGSGQESLTTQLYFPGDPYNESDPWIRPELVLGPLSPDAQGGRRGRFDFIL